MSTLRWEGDFVYGQYVRFIHVGESASKRTLVWMVAGRGGDGADDFELGYVKWFAPWKTYSFEPHSGTVFEKRCLRDIAQFCEELTKEHRERLKSKPIDPQEIPPGKGRAEG